ncbi:hypothetical protein BDP55DRAFT_221626 [Colletotrichum godetiae]|uniref:Uncharacterized protein n=1 Tax=Colletotrichum godetiae TaxID=1209918 RepID=A0AAJ0AGW4_9PEZI|nr:uncharacterized protein BDP55DRAFT_221626 [Colletotrichum godetiae]KAK1673684.1 hypothetical protein BDP55DRAFT_221626 [Colletotrichum godetiae]
MELPWCPSRCRLRDEQKAIQSTVQGFDFQKFRCCFEHFSLLSLRNTGFTWSHLSHQSCHLLASGTMVEKQGLACPLASSSSRFHINGSREEPEDLDAHFSFNKTLLVEDDKNGYHTAISSPEAASLELNEALLTDQTMMPPTAYRLYLEMVDIQQSLQPLILSKGHDDDWEDVLELCRMLERATTGLVLIVAQEMSALSSIGHRRDH